MTPDAVIPPPTDDEIEHALAILVLVGVATVQGTFPPSLVGMVRAGLPDHHITAAVERQIRRGNIPPAVSMMIRGPLG